MTDKTEIKVVAEAGQVLGRGEWTAFVELVLDEGGENKIVADHNPSSEQYSMTEDRWAGRTRVFDVSRLGEGTPAIADPEKMRAIADDLAPLVARVRAGMGIEWDGSSNVGTLTDDAAAAIDEIETAIYEEPGGPWTNHVAWDVAEWLDEEKSRVTSETTDEEIAEMVEEFADTAESEEVLFFGAGDERDTIETLLKTWRDDA